MKSEKFSGVRIVSEVAIEMRKAIIELAGSRAVFDSRMRWLERAAEKAGVSYRTAKALFYCEAANPHISAVEKVRAARARKKKDDALHTTANETYADLIARITRLEDALRVADEDFHSDQIDALRRMDSDPDRALD
ncbi:MAG: hypothetical protein WC026_15700 [Hyphomicrobium sp.]|uniref:hypothetical protein n=1 Tax=Hyphomicrobium sp. TaxID=82 RepID=UPI0035680181